MKTNGWKIDLIFGTGLDKNGWALRRDIVARALKDIDAAALKRFGGSSRVPTRGTWRDDKTGRVFVEQGHCLTVIVPPPRSRTEEKLLAGKVEALVFAIKLGLKQEAVAVVTTLVNIRLV